MTTDPILLSVAPKFTADWSIGSLIEDVLNLRGNDILIGEFLDYYYHLLSHNASAVPDDILTHDFQTKPKQFFKNDQDRSCVGFSHIDGEVIVVGDLHGDWISFLKVLFDADIIDKLRTGKLGQFILLGDYIDRGRCSFEVVMSVFILHALFFDKVTPLKGNHEVCLNICNEFITCITDCLTDKGLKNNIVGKFERIFGAMPYFAYVRDVKKFFVHGGIPIFFGNSFAELLSDDKNCESYLWSDPCKKDNLTGKVIFSGKVCLNDVRGEDGGFKFTAAALQDLEVNKIIPVDQCIRAHEAFDSFYQANVFGEGSLISLFTTGQTSPDADSEYKKRVRPYYAVFDRLEFDIELKALNRKGFMQGLSFLIALKQQSLNKDSCLSMLYSQGKFFYKMGKNDEEFSSHFKIPAVFVAAVFALDEEKDEKKVAKPIKSFKH